MDSNRLDGKIDDKRYDTNATIHQPSINRLREWCLELAFFRVSNVIEDS
ncbi:hypothetical protein HanIR_Chr09g0441111 [Helianthus annuus]|nr:hypothetical protein HanIR_Chr09g0441111 [Helianthus annuus]